MKTIISPSILGGSFSNMESTIKQLDSSHADYIHFDVMDGDFVPNLTFGPQFISNIRKYSNKVFKKFYYNLFGVLIFFKYRL